MTEAKRSDVRAALTGYQLTEVVDGKLVVKAPYKIADEIASLLEPTIEARVQAAVKNVQERLELMHQGNMDVLMNNLKEANAREQAAAVEMRERCARIAKMGICEEGEESGSDDFCVNHGHIGCVQAWQIMKEIHAIQVPTDALDATLLQARIEEHIELHAKGACGTGECLRLKNQRAELAALAQPAAEVNGAKD